MLKACMFTGAIHSFHVKIKKIMFDQLQILKLTRETRKMFPDITLSVTVPHTLSLQDQVYYPLPCIHLECFILEKNNVY
jgi:hypothetical protein